MIDIRHLAVQLSGNAILQEINFTICESKVIMVLGENGSGKTTLIKSLLCQLPYSGAIWADNTDIQMLSEKQRAAIFSYVPQIKEVTQDMLVEDCILAGCTRRLSLFETPSKKDHQRSDAIMQRFHLEHLKGKALHEISGGELQMCYVARAFLQDGKVMLMDEPCTYLDYRRQHLFLQESKCLASRKKSVLISIHDPNLALQYADEILLMHEGRLVAHLNRETNDMQQQLLVYYNELYGNHFCVAGNETSSFLVWKEREYAADTAICKAQKSTRGL